MPQEKPQYEEEKEFCELANKIVERYPQVFDLVDVEKICCVKITNKSRPQGKTSLWEAIGLKMPVTMHTPYNCYISIYSDDWEAMDNAHKGYLVAEVLDRVSNIEGNECKILPGDVKGSRVMIKTFGLDYLENPNAVDILENEINWKM